MRLRLKKSDTPIEATGSELCLAVNAAAESFLRKWTEKWRDKGLFIDAMRRFGFNIDKFIDNIRSPAVPAAKGG